MSQGPGRFENLLTWERSIVSFNSGGMKLLKSLTDSEFYMLTAGIRSGRWKELQAAPQSLNPKVSDAFTKSHSTESAVKHTGNEEIPPRFRSSLPELPPFFCESGFASFTNGDWHSVD